MEVSPKNDELTPIQKFYDGSDVFITGGTGFLGKLTIEKLLRSCPGIGTIYILVRNKEDKGVQERISEMFQDPVFSQMKQECPTFMQHVAGIAGDCGLPDLGISPDDRLILQENVSIVFHAAATIKFNAPIKKAVTTNIGSTMAVLKLCREMSNFKAGIYLSTAYSNCPHPEIAEKVYDPPMDSNDLINLLSHISDDDADRIAKKLLGMWPNTYSFTKAVSESIIERHAGDLPFGVFRPSVVSATVKEPIKGWVGNPYGATIFISLFNLGVLRVMNGSRSNHLDIIPADMTVNALIAYAWDVATLKKKNEISDIPVCNFVANSDVTIGKILDVAKMENDRLPMKNAKWYYCGICASNWIVFTICHFFLHFLPYCLIDCILFLQRKKPKMMKLSGFLYSLSDTGAFFMNKEWIFSNERVRYLIGNMSDRDRQLFYCDVKSIDWESYLMWYARGIRTYICKETLDSVPQARIKWRRLYWIHQCFKTVILLGLGTFVYSMVSEMMSTSY